MVEEGLELPKFQHQGPTDLDTETASRRKSKAEGAAFGLTGQHLGDNRII